MKYIFDFLGKIVDFFFPHYCVGCKREGRLVCENCHERLVFQPSVVDDDIISLFNYENKIVKELLWRLKYKNNLEVAKVFGADLADYLFGEYEEKTALDVEKEKWVVVPAPIFWLRKNRRGYNQAEILAREITLAYPDCFELRTDLVRKIKNTKPQVKCKSRRERLENLTNAFEVNLPADCVRRQFIILDDVTTTGSTLTEINKILKKAGAKKVRSVVIAHG
jgi:competence protein ComFC